MPATPEQVQPAAAQEPMPTAVPEADPAASQQPVILDPTARAKTEVTLDRKTRVGAGIGFLRPPRGGRQRAGLHGLGADVRDGSTRVKAVCAIPMPHCAQGFLLQADAGSGGGKLSLGLGAWAKIDEESFRGTAGLALRLALARTWGNPIGTDPGLYLSRSRARPVRDPREPDARRPLPCRRGPRLRRALQLGPRFGL